MSYPIRRKPFLLRSALILGLILVCTWSSAFAQPGLSDSERDSEIVQRIDAAVLNRSQHIAAYNVQELYSIYRNGESSPSAQVIVKTVYNRATGKEYTPISATGSSLLRNVIIDKVLASEKEMAKAANRESVSVTSANYEMSPVPGKVSLNGRDCILVTLKARRKVPHLMNGKAWFDASDFTLVHLEGAPAQSVSIFAGDMQGTRDYDRIEGFSMAQHAEMHTHNFLFGSTVLRIDYSNYQIQLQP